MISVFTPSHKPDKLAAAWQSILRQGDVEFEWIVVLNGDAIYTNDDKRVRVIQAPDWMCGNVGALKRLACENAKGDIFVELDHDDQLLPMCLKIIQSALDDKENSFFYSATMEIGKTGEPIVYGSAFGWEHGEHKGKKFNVPFPATPRSLCEIFYAPNHVRAWKATTYWKAGGHDPRMSVCDDQDLLIRTYLVEAEFLCHPEPLYLQILDGTTTQSARNAEIQRTQAAVRDRSIMPLAEEWCRREGLKKFDLGGAHGGRRGFTPVDTVKVDGGIQWDIANNGIPAEDNSVGIIRASDFMEHVPIGKVVPLMNDIYRALAPGGWLMCNTPSTDGRGAFCDPTHVSFWNQLSMRYYTDKNFSKYVPEIQCRFQAVRNFTHFPNEWSKEQNLSYVVSDLCALKGQRQAGQSLI